MNTPNPSDTQTDLSRVLEKITEIANASATGDYIYRGESKCHGKVRSGLYREYEADIEAENFDIEIVQNEILKEAKEYTHKTDDLEILTELQHHGGKTNLIDFTTDYLVALFFACDGNRYNPGRVILLQNQSGVYEVVKPPRTIARAGIQKSIFVQAPSGVVDPHTVVYIPSDLKGKMLDYLRKHHDISTKTIYNDLQGFIENRSSHKSVYTEFYKGLTCQDRGDSEKDSAEKQAWYDKAVAHYTEAIGLNPKYAAAYNNRGKTYDDKGEFDLAIQDYNIAIALNPEYAYAYNNRGVAYNNNTGEFDLAIQDYNIAIALNPEYADAYNNRGTAYNNKGSSDSAIQDYNRAIDLNPDHAYAYYNRGNVYLAKDDLDLAIQDYNRVIDLNPELAGAYSNRGNVYLAKDDLDLAIQDYNRAIDLNPELANTYSNRGTAYSKKGEFDSAIQDFNAAIDLNPELAGVYTNRGIAYAGRGKLSTAIHNYNKAIELDPELAEAYSNRGEAWLLLREWERARVDLSTAKEFGIDLVSSFRGDYGSIENFEAKHGVNVPEDIAALLSRD